MTSEEGENSDDSELIKQELWQLRKAVTDACRRLMRLGNAAGNGADGHLWQKHHEIYRDLIAESLYVNKDKRDVVPRVEYDEVLKRLTECRSREVLNRSRGEALAEFKNLFRDMADHLDYCKYGDSWERETAKAVGLMDRIDKMLGRLDDLSQDKVELCP